MTVLAARGLLLWLALTASVAALGRWTLAGASLTGRLDDVLAGIAALALVGCAAWAWLVATVVLVQALRGRAGRGVRGVPGWAVRAVLVACGIAALAAAPSPASDDARGGPTPAGPSLDGLPLPDRPTGPARPALPALPTSTAHPGPPEAPAATRHVEVAPGDCLWTIAARLLGPGADDAEIARATAALYAANHDAVGPDPDLIHPGLDLRTPTRPEP